MTNVFWATFKEAVHPLGSPGIGPNFIEPVSHVCDEMSSALYKRTSIEPTFARARSYCLNKTVIVSF